MNTLDEIKRRNFTGRTFELTQENARLLQLDVEYLIELITNAEYIHKPSREDVERACNNMELCETTADGLCKELGIE